MYEVTYIGMDGSWNSEEYETLDEAKQARVWIEEHGGQCIYMYDENGEEL